ncbi:Kelch repeat-containing protein [Sunxiuqinia sp. sy24]|uniref:Kelch repeat-containing protein n=1 Tax=Sunxiuqinia sp. sy24 TaxID=3461495 RepID=UPI0040463202
MEKEPYLNRMPVPVRLGMSFLLNDQLFVYEVNDVFEGFPSIASMDFTNYLWKSNSSLTLEKQRHHHNAYLDTENQQFYIFGGFGNKRLSSSFNRYNIVKDTWDTVDFKGDEVSPRYFSGMAELDNNKLLLFGGIGNETGDQSIGRKYYYDCYQIDIRSRHIKKLWDVDRPDMNLVSSRNMIISDDSASFYTLCYPEYIPKTHVKLHQYNIKTGAFSVLGDSIPITSERIRTYANLYSNTQSKELYCVVMEILGENDSKVSVYSIDNPPVPAEVLFEQPQKEEGGRSLFWWIMYAVLLISTLIILRIWFLIKRKNQLIAKRPVKKDTHQPIIGGHIDGPLKNSMYIFGVFTVFDRQGTDITHLFSPQVKQLFLFILLKSRTDGEGVTSEHIYNSVWPEKPMKNAKNLKGVTLNKLRNILADIDGIELLYENQSFRVQSTTPFYCDYLEYKLAYYELSNEINDLNIGRIIEITSTGQFLKSVNNDYFDPFKKEVSDQIMGIVPIILKRNFAQRNYSRTISIASILYLAEELNECAFYYILKSYLRLGDKTAARKHYVDYAIRYERIMGENYNIPYQEAISNAKKFR